MALPNHVREHLARVREGRRAAQSSVAAGSSSLRNIVESSRLDSSLADMYVVKILEVSPLLGKVRARRILQELQVGPMTPLCAVDDEMVSRIEARL